MNRRISVRGIALHDGKLLCVRLKPYKGSVRAAGSDYWCLPGGGLEPGEALLDGMSREMVEETGVEPDIGKLLYVQQFLHGGQDYLEFFFHITNGGDYLDVDLTQASHGELEIAEIAFVDPARTHILPEFLSADDLQAAVDSGSGPKIVSRLP